MGAAPRRFGWSAHRGRRRAPSLPGRPCFDRGAPSPLGDVDGKGQTDCLAGRTPSLNSPLRSRKPAASRPPDLGQSRSSERQALTARLGGSCSKKTIRGGDHSKKTHPIEHLLMRLDQSPTISRSWSDPARSDRGLARCDCRRARWANHENRPRLPRVRSAKFSDRFSCRHVLGGELR